MASPPRRMRARGEDRYRVRRLRGATYFTSRQPYDDLTIVVQRFPRRHEGDGPAFVLVHGIGVSSRYFGPAAAELARQGPVHLVDLPGYGAAPNPRRDVSLDDHADVVARFLVAAGLHDAVLVGHSMGAQVVARLAVRHPGAVGAIVLMAPTVPPDARTVRAAVARLLRDGLREPLRVNLIAAADYLVRCGLPYLLRQMPHLLGDRLEDHAGRIRARTLVLVGDRDPIVPTDWAGTVAALVPGARLEVVRGAHVIMHTDPEAVARAIAEHAR